jgi:hypothetical protein
MLIVHHVVGLYRWSKTCYFEFFVVLFNPFWYYCTLFPCYSTVVPYYCQLLPCYSTLRPYYLPFLSCYSTLLACHYIQQLGQVIQRLYCLSHFSRIIVDSCKPRFIPG